MVIKVKYNGEWVKIPYLSSDHGRELVEEAPKDGKQYARQNGVWSVVNIPEVDFTEVYNAIDTKVDKVEGKGLSTNDYVTADKTKVTNINEVVEAATKNITATGISITLDKRNLVTNVVGNIELNLPASTTALAGLMLPSDKTKLNGIAAGAEVNVNADWNATEGDALILNKPPLPTGATTTTPTHRLTACRWCWLAVTRTTGRMRASLACVRIMRLPLRLVTSVRAFAFSPNFVKRRRSRTYHVGNFFV